MVAKLGQSAGAVAAVLLLATGAVQMDDDAAIVIQLHGLNHDELTMARIGQAEAQAEGQADGRKHHQEDHRTLDRHLVPYAARKEHEHGRRPAGAGRWGVPGRWRWLI